MRRALGGVTLRGRCLLAAGLAAGLCAVVLDERDLLRVAVFAMSLPLLASLVSAGARLRLQAVRDLPARLPVGSSGEARLTVTSPARLAGALLLQDTVPATVGASPRFVISPTRTAEPTRLRYPLRPGHRGVYRLGPLVALVTDPLGLVERARTLTGPGRLVVPPAVVPLAGVPAGVGLVSAEHGVGRPLSAQNVDAVVVRGYRQGDDLRKVHWRSTARRDELMVRVEELPSRGSVTVLLDHRGEAHRGHGPTSSLEYAVSLVASICAHLEQRGQRVRLVDADGTVLVGAEQGSGSAEHRVNLALDALAALSASPRRELVAGPALAGSHTVVAVLGAAGPAVTRSLLDRRPPGQRSHAVLLDVATWARVADRSDDPEHDREGDREGADPAGSAQLLRAGGWSAVIARGPAASQAAVWDELCQASSGSPAGGSPDPGGSGTGGAAAGREVVP